MAGILVFGDWLWQGSLTKEFRDSCLRGRYGCWMGELLTLIFGRDFGRGAIHVLTIGRDLTKVRDCWSEAVLDSRYRKGSEINL
jgi:hypothetical protein